MRRDARTVAALAVVGLLLGACGASAGDATGTEGPDGEPIAIGFLGELTGNFAIWGVPARNGMRLAVDEINDDGGIDGRPLELVERDTRSAPEEGVTALRGLVERDEVVAVGGLVDSDVALATAREAEVSEVPLFLVKAGSPRILTAESRFTFRTCLPAAPMTMEPFAQLIDDEGIERVAAIVADYEWGRAIEQAIEERIAPLTEQLRIEVAPVGENDFTAYLRRLEELDPELIIGTGHPPGAVAMTEQAADLGFDGRVTGPNSPVEVVMETIGETAYERYVDLSCADYGSSDYQALARRYHARFDAFMEDDAVSGYAQVTMVAEAIEATGSHDPTDIAGYLRETTFDPPGYAWDLRWTSWGELADAQPLLTVIRETEPPQDVAPDAAWYPQTLFQAEPLEPFDPQR
ncbi:MAG: ABC transporter substrate-binding protein [Nitriliruptoraceae bacterium]